ncbi:MAG: hypothetical protein OXH85_05805 [Truepera sp.]|nr:hypothetical protein [Truepera sp.]
MCGKLGLPDPHIDSSPAARQYGSRDGHLPCLVESGNFLWLALIPPASTVSPVLPGGGEYCVDVMIEHVVVHTIRHGFQLPNLVE